MKLSCDLCAIEKNDKKEKRKRKKKGREIREEEQGKLAGSRNLFSAGKNK